MTSAVLDTSPIIALAAVGVLHVVTDVFAPCLVPSEVLAEVQRDPAKQCLAEMIESDAIKVTEVTNRALMESLRETLGLGESAAIALALEQHIRVLVLDDSRARKVAQRLGIRILGTAGLLRHCRDQGKLDNLEERIRKLVQHGFHISPAVLEKILK